jgi:hypothetical protein
VLIFASRPRAFGASEGRERMRLLMMKISIHRSAKGLRSRLATFGRERGRENTFSVSDFRIISLFKRYMGKFILILINCVTIDDCFENNSYGVASGELYSCDIS